MSRQRKTILRMSPDIESRPWYVRKLRATHLERMHKLRKRESMTVERVVDSIFDLGLTALEGNGNATRKVLSPSKGAPGRKVLRRRAGKVEPVAPPEKEADEEFQACPHCKEEIYFKAFATHVENCAAWQADRDAEVVSPKQGLSVEDDE